MDSSSPEESLGTEGARKLSQQDAANSAMEAFMMALQRYGAEQGRFANIPSNFEDALLKRLEALTAQLAPLRELSPPVTELTDEVFKQLAAIRKSMERPDWNNAKRLDPGPRSGAHPFYGGTPDPITAQSA